MLVVKYTNLEEKDSQFQVIKKFIHDQMGMDHNCTPNKVYTCILDEGLLIGLACMQDNILENLCIHKICRRKGLGKRLVDKILSESGSIKFRVLTKESFDFFRNNYNIGVDGDMLT